MPERRLTKLTAAPRLETERLILRAHDVGDFAESAAMRRDPEVYRYISGKPSSDEESWTRLLRYRGHWALLGFGYWVVAARDDGRYLGEVGFANYRRDIDPPLGDRPEAGWTLKSTEHGRGLATEAVRRIVAWADATLEVPSTACIITPEHAASIKVATKAGYVERGQATYRGLPTLVMERPRERTYVLSQTRKSEINDQF